MTTPHRIFAALLIILLDLLGRAGLDKMLAWNSTPEIIAWWAQLQSVVELVGAVAVAGVLQGLSVMVSQTRIPQAEATLLRLTLKLGLLLSCCVALITISAAPWLSSYLTHSNVSSQLFWLAALTGCLTVLPATLNAYWLGKHLQTAMLRLSCLTLLVWFAIALAAQLGATLPYLLWVQCLAMAGIAFGTGRYMLQLFRGSPPADPATRQKLAKFIPVGLAIGILSPLSMLLIRSILSSTLSWHDVGMMQALWRSTEWVTATAAGVLSLLFLPRFSNTCGTPHFGREIIRAAILVLIPTAVLLLLIFFNQRSMLAALYDSRFKVSDTTVLWFTAGCWIRIASWVFLFGLFATHRTRLITIGEFLSLPLYVALLWLFTNDMTLERAAMLHAVTYLVYLTFNAVALWHASGRQVRSAISDTPVLPPPG